jgi:hypothetical protein
MISQSVAVAAVLLLGACSTSEPSTSANPSAPPSTASPSGAPAQVKTPPASTPADDEHARHMTQGMPPGMQMDDGGMHDGGMHDGGMPMPDHPMPGRR